jgi:hypothetical protein
MKLNIIILLTFALSANVLAQNSKFLIGLEGGPGISYLKRTAFEKNGDNPIIGFSGGLTFQYNFYKMLSLRTIVAFERKGSVTDYYEMHVDGQYLGDYRYLNHFTYFTVPIFLRATFGKKINFFIDAGGFISYLIKEKVTYQANYGEKIRIYDETGTTKRYDAGIALGLGISYSIKEIVAVSFEIRDNLGLYNLNIYDPWGYNEDLKTNSINFLIGLEYKIKGRQKENK